MLTYILVAYCLIALLTVASFWNDTAPKLPLIVRCDKHKWHMMKIETLKGISVEQNARGWSCLKFYAKACCNDDGFANHNVFEIPFWAIDTFSAWCKAMVESGLWIEETSQDMAVAFKVEKLNDRHQVVFADPSILEADDESVCQHLLDASDAYAAHGGI